MPADPPPWAVTCARIGARVRDRRLHQNLTQEGLRELTGISVDTIHRIESGRSDPKVSHLHRIATALDMDLASLFVDEPLAPGVENQP